MVSEPAMWSPLPSTYSIVPRRSTRRWRSLRHPLHGLPGPSARSHQDRLTGYGRYLAHFGSAWGVPGQQDTLGIRRIMFAVEDIEDVLARLHAHGAELIGELDQYEDSYRLCYVRRPEASSSRWPSSSAEAFEAGHDPDGNPNIGDLDDSTPRLCVGTTSPTSSASTTDVIIWLE
jgi:hypothetical protein